MNHPGSSVQLLSECLLNIGSFQYSFNFISRLFIGFQVFDVVKTINYSLKENCQVRDAPASVFLMFVENHLERNVLFFFLLFFCCPLLGKLINLSYSVQHCNILHFIFFYFYFISMFLLLVCDRNDQTFMKK